MKSQLYLPLHPLYLRIRVAGRIIAPDPDLHHLQEVNGVWCVRASIDRGPKLVAERVKESLGGCPLPVHPDHQVEMAKWVRDKCLSFATKCGVTFSPGTRLPNVAAYQKRRKK
ncbi:hypothetical protein KBB96_09355 [Luteolibacter ambystomatis]|uniref:Uncharacterized protein n=1 Tax=Luteolibacter ambystomatis TaxID=2824561 RepID=A0A975J2Y8_9BACT|nr:hypothetical protein [Luteolibacter ambystomatis]QUE53085.1 hypothetical protein KBB96_09355 [Luteolibacter ambystomatis]